MRLLGWWSMFSFFTGVPLRHTPRGPPVSQPPVSSSPCECGPDRSCASNQQNLVKGAGCPSLDNVTSYVKDDGCHTHRAHVARMIGDILLLLALQEQTVK